jgi:hypothetical protein
MKILQGLLMLILGISVLIYSIYDYKQSKFMFKGVSFIRGIGIFLLCVFLAVMIFIGKYKLW